MKKALSIMLIVCGFCLAGCGGHCVCDCMVGTKETRNPLGHMTLSECQSKCKSMQSTTPYDTCKAYIEN